MINRHAPTAARILLGLMFLVFGLNGFLSFLPMPPLAGAPGAFMGALAATGYMFPLIKATEVIAGALLLSNRFVPLALTVLAPIVVNIVAFHLVLERSAGMSVVLAGLLGYLAWAYRGSFRGVLAAKAAPASEGGRVSRRVAGELSPG
jgi:hypothetical protein